MDRDAQRLAGLILQTEDNTMKKLTIFIMASCPYCRKAEDAVKELRSEDPAYEKVEIEWIDETVHPEIAGRYDYYYVPSVFCGDEKLYECSPKDDYAEIKRQIERTMKFAARDSGNA